MLNRTYVREKYPDNTVLEVLPVSLTNQSSEQTQIQIQTCLGGIALHFILLTTVIWSFF